MYINTFKYSPADVDCKLCTEYQKKYGCTSNCCPWLAERIEAGVVCYTEAILDTFEDQPILLPRLHLLIQCFPGTMFYENHRKRMEKMKSRLGYRRYQDSPAFHAVLYLMTANPKIYTRAANCFYRHGVEFGYARLRDISPHNYTLLMAARSIYTGKGCLNIDDLADAEVIDPEAFRLIVNALLIARYGPYVLDIHKRRATT